MTPRRATAFDEPTSYMIVRRILSTLLVLFLCFGIISANRAYTQVRSVNVSSPPTLHGGETITGRIVSSGRVAVMLNVDLVQGDRRLQLASHMVPGNRDPFFNFIFRHDSTTAVISPTALSNFSAGPAELVATGLGRSQWLRVPPPVTFRLPVAIAK